MDLKTAGMGKKSGKHSGKRGERTPEGGKRKGKWSKPLNLDLDGALRVNTNAANRR